MIHFVTGFRNRALGALALTALTAGLAAAADNVTQQHIAFAAGATEATVEGAVAGYDSVEYQVAAELGQTMTVALEADNASTYFNVYRPGDVSGLSTALHVGPRDGNAWRAVLRKSGDYTVQVFLIRAAARRAETAAFTLTVGVSGAAAGTTQDAAASDATPAPDFADGLAGGPDFWEVAGLDPGDELNLRAGPSIDAAVLARFPEGTILRNRGCKMTGTRRWCDVEARDDASLRGWASGRYLHEAPATPAG